MKKLLVITALLAMLGVTLTLGGCGWYGCNYPTHSDKLGQMNHTRATGDYAWHNNY